MKFDACKYGKMFFELKYPDYDFYFIKTSSSCYAVNGKTYFHYRGCLKNPKKVDFPCDAHISTDNIWIHYCKIQREKKLKRLLKND